MVADERLPEVQEYGRNLQLGYLVFGKDTLGRKSVVSVPASLSVDSHAAVLIPLS